MSEASAEQPRRFRLLVVDDNESIRSEMKQLLVRNGLDLQFVEAQNGVEALKALTTSSPDLVLCDVQMPVMDGFQFLRLLRARSEFESIAVIMLTGRDDPQEKVFGLE